MTPMFKAIPVVLLSVPMIAQSQWVAGRVGYGGSAFLLHVGERGDPLYEALQELLWTDELAEMGISFESLQITSPVYAQLRNELGLASDSTWALTDNRGRRLIQGNKLPSAADMRNALNQAGVKSPVSVLRDFIKQYPDHLDARQQLLGRLRLIAENRTRRVLQLNVKSPIPELDSQDPMVAYRQRSRLVNVDTSQLEDKQLKPEQDLQIWGPCAQELQTLYSSGEWRILPAILSQHSIPADVCSPIMIQTYRRNLANIEAYIEEYPSSIELWRYYGWILSITKQSSVRTLFNRLVPSPYMLWPPEQALGLLVSEERAKGNWGFIAETLMSNWPRFRGFVYQSARMIRTYGQPPDLAGVSYAKGTLEVVWRDHLNPLLESLIKTNRIADAETIIFDAVKFNAYRDFQRRAAELALSCGRSDLQAKWLALQIPEKSDAPDIDDLNVMLNNGMTDPYLAIINAEMADIQQADAMLKQGRLFEWRISAANPPPVLSELMRQREGWPEGVKYWALFDTDKVIAHGSGLPTENTLYQTLEQYNIETPANTLRRFIREYPTHFEAKEQFLRELKRIAEQRTREKLGEDAGINLTSALPENEDQAIWGEYASLYRQLLPYNLEQGRMLTAWLGSAYYSDFFIHSQTMKSLAPALLPQAETRLRRQPADAFLWGAWTSLSDLDERQSFRNLKEALVLSPMDNPLNQLPPPIPRELMMRRLSARSNWQGIIDVQEWRWETMRNNMERNPSRLSRYLWSQEMQYLLEAYLRLDKNSEANEFIRIWGQSPEWPQIKQSAVDLAEKCGRGDLAEQWKKVGF